MLWHRLLTVILLLGPGVIAGSPESSSPSALNPLQTLQSSDPLGKLSTTLQGLTTAFPPALLADLTDVVHDAAYLLRAPTTNTTKALLATASELLNLDTVPKILAAGTALGQIITPDVINHLAQLDVDTLLEDFGKMYTTVKNAINAYSPFITNMISLLSGINIPPEMFESVLRNIQPYVTLVVSTLAQPESIETTFTKLTLLISELNSAITPENLQQLGEVFNIVFGVLTPEFANDVRSAITHDIPGSRAPVS
jgi:hypothetical protein